MLENLEPAKKVTAPKDFRPGLQFDGNEGTATTEGLPDAPNFDEFLEARGYPADEYEIVGTPRTSQWQRWDGEWLTAYRFHFRKKVTDLDLPTLYAQAKRTKVKPVKKSGNSRTYVIAPADFQIGKFGSRGGHEESIARIHASYARIEQKLKAGNYDHIVILDMGDIVEGISNKADMEQVMSNTLSPMQQTDLAAALIWDLDQDGVQVCTRSPTDPLPRITASTVCRSKLSADPVLTIGVLSSCNRFDASPPRLGSPWNAGWSHNLTMKGSRSMCSVTGHTSSERFTVTRLHALMLSNCSGRRPYSTTPILQQQH